MSVSTVSVPVPASGEGAAVSVATFVGEKTVVLAGSFEGYYDLLVTQDGVRFVPALTFAGGAAEQTVSGAFSAVKLRSRAQATGTVTCTVSAVSAVGQNGFAQVASLPAGFTGYGPVVDTSVTLPPSGPEVDTCYLCDGVFEGLLVVEGSNDGVKFEPVASFRADPLPPDSAGDLRFFPVLSPQKARYVRVYVDGVVLSPTVVTLGGGVPAAVPPGIQTAEVPPIGALLLYVNP